MIDDILSKPDYSREDVISLLLAKDNRDLLAIISRADEVRKIYCGNEVHLRGIIEISNYCSQNCSYCGLRIANKSLPRYRLDLNEIIEAAKTITSHNIQTIVLQSGEDSGLSTSFITEIITEIKNETGAAITLSLGERNFYDYEKWKKAGADRYLLKHETANPKLYSAFHRGQKLKERLDHLRFLKIIGFQIGAGNLIGLPGQTIPDIADDILLCKELDADMVSISPLIPSPATPFKNITPPELCFVLKILAIARIILKNAHMPATTAVGTLDETGREKALQAGANVIMPNFTPAPYKSKYLIYPGNRCKAVKPDEDISRIYKMIKIAGRTIADDKGDSLKIQHSRN